MDIDLVCCWVDLDDDYLDELNKYKGVANSKGALNKGRFRQLGELSFSIPLAIKNLPWLRKVFIVTNGQMVPEEISGLEKVVVVHHRDFFRDLNHLPTFSYHSIQPNVCFIDGLAENFILTNDDIFITRPLEKEAFLGKSGHGVFRHTTKSINFPKPENVWQWNLKSSDDALTEAYGKFDRKIFPHAPQLFNKSYCFEVWEKFERALNSASSNKFRENENVIFRALYPYYVMYDKWSAKHFSELQALSGGDVGYFEKGEYGIVPLNALGNGCWEEKLSSFPEEMPTYLCLNDNIPERAYGDAAPVVLSHLKRLFNS